MDNNVTNAAVLAGPLDATVERLTSEVVALTREVASLTRTVHDIQPTYNNWPVK